MSERMEEELMEDLYDEAEGPAQMAEEEYEDAYEEDLGEEEWDAVDEGDYAEEDIDAGVDEDVYDEGEDYGDIDEGDLEDAMAYALGAEDTDEFFRRAFGALRRVAGGVARVARRVAPVVGRIARIAAPIARMIPHPWAQAAGPMLGLLGRLRAEGATEEEALDAFAELAAVDESAIPIVAGLAARTVLRGRAARMPMAARRRIVHGMTTAARTLQRRGPGAIRALPRIARSVRRTAAVRRTPVRAMPRVMQRTTARVARRASLVRRLSRPSPAARRRVRAVGGAVGVGGGGRSFTMQGPVRISITSAA
jgi:hypothetical protein